MTGSPVSDGTPATPGAGATNPINGFTDKEQKLLIAAMCSLKSGVPDIDMTKFVKAGEFNTMKTAQNSWGKIKKKLEGTGLMTTSDGDGGSTSTPATPKATPRKKKGTATPVKRSKAEDDDDDGEYGEATSSPQKKRKSPVKNESARASAVPGSEEED